MVTMVTICYHAPFPHSLRSAPRICRLSPCFPHVGAETGQRHQRDAHAAQHGPYCPARCLWNEFWMGKNGWKIRPKNETCWWLLIEIRLFGNIQNIQRLRKCWLVTVFFLFQLRSFCGLNLWFCSTATRISAILWVSHWIKRIPWNIICGWNPAIVPSLRGWTSVHHCYAIWSENRWCFI